MSVLNATRRVLIAWPLLTLAFAACSGGSALSSRIGERFEASGRTGINLAEVVDGQWDRVCVLGPYSDNQAAKKTLGFDWDAERETSIHTNDGISLLLFVNGGRVAYFAEHPRLQGDFTKLSRQCFARTSAQFVRERAQDQDWPHLAPK